MWQATCGGQVRGPVHHILSQVNLSVHSPIMSEPHLGGKVGLPVGIITGDDRAWPLRFARIVNAGADLRVGPIGFWSMFIGCWDART